MSISDWQHPTISLREHYQSSENVSHAAIVFGSGSFQQLIRDANIRLGPRAKLATEIFTDWLSNKGQKFLQKASRQQNSENIVALWNHHNLNPKHGRSWEAQLTNQVSRQSYNHRQPELDTKVFKCVLCWLNTPEGKSFFFPRQGAGGPKPICDTTSPQPTH